MQANLFHVRTRGAASLPATHAWLCRLLRANAEHRVYEPSAFARVLVMQWLYVCQAAPGARWTRLRAFTDAGLVRAARLSLGQWVGLLAESARKAWGSWYARSAARRGKNWVDPPATDRTL